MPKSVVGNRIKLFNLDTGGLIFVVGFHGLRYMVVGVRTDRTAICLVKTADYNRQVEKAV